MFALSICHRVEQIVSVNSEELQVVTINQNQIDWLEARKTFVAFPYDLYYNIKYIGIII